MANFDSCAFSIAFSSSTEITEEPDNYLITIEGEVLCVDDSGKRHVAGKLRLFFADLDGAMQDGYDSYFILDMKQATAPFYPILFNAKQPNEFKSNIRRLIGDDIYSLNLLILDRLEILPAYRRKRLGLASLYRCIQQHWHGSGLVALKCFPLQFEPDVDSSRRKWLHRMRMEELGEDHKSCQAKLEKYYSLLGFKKIGKTEYMIMNPSHIQPSFKDLGLSQY